MRFHQRVLAVLFVLPSVATSANAQNVEPGQPATPAAQDGESLGGQLMNDLGGAAPAGQAPAKTEPVNPELRFREPPKFNDLGDDLGAPSGPLPLVRAKNGMQQAGALLAQPGGVADARVEQKRVVSQLDELINTLCKQCQGGNCPPSDKPPKPGPPKPGNKTGAKPGMSAIGPRNSSDELKAPGAKPVDMAEREAMAKQLWGHLPERSREQMQQSFSTEFLPKYETELEKYYRRLSEGVEPESGKAGER